MLYAVAMPMRDHYDVLGVSSQASDKDIKVAYKQLALKLHPDVRRSSSTREGEEGGEGGGGSGAADDFRKVAEAYEVLSDKHQRALYDYSRNRAKQSSSRHTTEGDWDDFLRSQSQKYSNKNNWQQKQSRWKTEADQRQRERAAREAWEEEKKEAKRRKVRTRERLIRTEEAHRVRVGTKLREFWQTSPNIHRNDIVFLSCMSGCMVSLVLFSWM